MARLNRSLEKIILASLFYGGLCLISLDKFFPILAQSPITFSQNGITYTVDVKETQGQERVFSVSHQQSNGNRQTREYRGSCDGNTIAFLSETILDPQGQILSEEKAAEVISFEINSESSWQFSDVIRQSLELSCD